MMNVDIENDEIVIRFPIDHLDSAFSLSPYVLNFEHPDDEPKISDLYVFAQSIVETLRMEREDGSTFVHDAFDAAFEYVVEYGLDELQGDD